MLLVVQQRAGRVRTSHNSEARGEQQKLPGLESLAHELAGLRDGRAKKQLGVSKVAKAGAAWYPQCQRITSNRPLRVQRITVGACDSLSLHTSSLKHRHASFDDAMTDREHGFAAMVAFAVVSSCHVWDLTAWWSLQLATLHRRTRFCDGDVKYGE